MSFGSPVTAVCFWGKLVKQGLKAGALTQWSSASCLTGEHTALETKPLLTGVVGIHPVEQHPAQTK